MMGDNDKKIKRLAVNKIQALQGKSLQHTIPNCNFKGGYIKDYQNTEGAVNISSIRVFEVPIINVNAQSFHQIVNLNEREVKQLPTIKHLSNLEIEVPELNHPCHNQHVERLGKLITEASSQVCGIDCHDGLIGKKLKSRQIMKKFHTKHQFTV